MEKILITKYGNCIVYDTDKNAIARTYDGYCTERSLIIVRTDGQVITNNKVIDVKAGDMVIPQPFYSKKEEDHICDVVVVHDPVAAYDLNEIEKLKEEHSKSNK